MDMDQTSSNFASGSKALLWVCVCGVCSAPANEYVHFGG